MEKLEPGLYLVATPLGNIGDVSQRAREVLAHVDAIACEDTRELKKLLALIGVDRGERNVLSLHEHNEHDKAQQVIDLIIQGSSVAYASDAGMPAISDPGSVLVDCAHEANVYVTCIPGASAVTTAVALSGLANSSFRFIGFFPREKKEKEHCVTEMKSTSGLTVFYESPKRLGSTLSYLAQDMPHTRAVVCRELTKKFEEIKRGTIQELSEYFSTDVKGECVVVVQSISDDDKENVQTAIELERLMGVLVDAQMSSKDAVELVHSTTGQPKNKLKDLFNRMKSES